MYTEAEIEKAHLIHAAKRHTDQRLSVRVNILRRLTAAARSALFVTVIVVASAHLPHKRADVK